MADETIEKPSFSLEKNIRKLATLMENNSIESSLFNKWGKLYK